MPQDPEAPRTQRETVPGVIQRLRIGRLAAVCAGIEVPATILSLITHDPNFAEAGGFLDAILVGATMMAAHNHHVNGLPNDDPMHSFVRDRAELNSSRPD